MEDIEILNLWKAQGAKIEQSLAINKKLLKAVISQKVESALQSLIRLKTRGIIVLIIYLVLLGLPLFYAIFHYSSAANYFIVSIGAIFLINVRALYDYIKHLIWANNMNYNGSITEIQQKLTSLQLSIFKHSRIMVLQFPFWTTFCLSNKWFPQDMGWSYFVFQFLLTGSFTYIAYWLYKNLVVENAYKEWIKGLIAGSGGKAIMKALEFCKEMEEFKMEK